MPGSSSASPSGSPSTTTVPPSNARRRFRVMTGPEATSWLMRLLLLGRRCAWIRPSLDQPAKHLRDAQAEASRDVLTLEHALGPQALRRTTGAVDIDRFLVAIDQPAERTSMRRRMHQFLMRCPHRLAWGNDLHMDIGRERCLVGNFALFVAGDSFVSEKGDIGNDRPAREGAAEFCESL